MKVDRVKIKSFYGNGGKRPGAGRKKGGKNKATIEKQLVEEELRQRVLRSAQKLLDSQLNLAEGCQYLYKIEHEIDKDGKRRKRPEKVTTRMEIEEYLSGENDDPEKYFFVTTERPDNKALDSLWDRVFGKAPQRIEMDLEGEVKLDVDIKRAIDKAYGSY